MQKFSLSNQMSPHFKTLELWGECELKLGNPLSAIIPLTAASALNRGVRSLSLLSQAYLELGKEAEAVKFAQAALNKEPNNKLAKSVLNRLCANMVSAK